jgi:hypothetical protein
MSNNMSNNMSTTTPSSTDILAYKTFEYTRYTGYVRVRMPEKYSIIDESPNPWKMTMQHISIGNIHCLSECDNGEDDGFFVYSFDFVNEAEAEITEQILRHEFRRCTFHDSSTFCTQLLVPSLGYTDYSSSSYDAYMEVARRLFARMVAIARLNWPHHYNEHNNGYRYKIEECVTPKDDHHRVLTVTCAPIMTE